MSRINLPAISLFGLAILAFWEVGARMISNPFAPTLSATLTALIANAGTIGMEMAATLRRAAIGLAITLATMIPFGILVGRIRTLGEIFEPLINLLRPLPPPAVARSQCCSPAPATVARSP